MRDFEILFYHCICITLFLSVQYSKAAIVELGDPNSTFIRGGSARIHTLFVKAPNKDDFSRHLAGRPMFLGVHNDRETLSFYELGASCTISTFKQEMIDFKIFHSQSMSFHVEENTDVWHFRVVFSANKHTLDVLFSYLLAFKKRRNLNRNMDIVKVESYVRMDQTQDPIIQKVDDLEPAMFYDRNIVRLDPDRKLFLITPMTKQRAHKKPRLVFRTGTYQARRVDDKVVLEFSGFSGCLYILYFNDSLIAEAFLDIIGGRRFDRVLRITRDVLLYLQHGSSQTRTQNVSEPQSSSPVDDTLQLADWRGKHSRSDQGSSGNVRSESDDDSD